MSPAVPKMRATPRGGGADMSPSHGRSEDGRYPARRGRAQRGGADMSPSHGRPKTGDTPRGGVARSAGVRT